ANQSACARAKRDAHSKFPLAGSGQTREQRINTDRRENQSESTKSSHEQNCETSPGKSLRENRCKRACFHNRDIAIERPEFLLDRSQKRIRFARGPDHICARAAQRILPARAESHWLWRCPRWI